MQLQSVSKYAIITQDHLFWLSSNGKSQVFRLCIGACYTYSGLPNKRPWSKNIFFTQNRYGHSLLDSGRKFSLGKNDIWSFIRTWSEFFFHVFWLFEFTSNCTYWTKAFYVGSNLILEALEINFLSSKKCLQCTSKPNLFLWYRSGLV